MAAGIEGAATTAAAAAARADTRSNRNYWWEKDSDEWLWEGATWSDANAIYAVRSRFTARSANYVGG